MRATKASTLFASVCSLIAASSLISGTQAQAVTQQQQDPITIVGTWASGSGQVSTGLVSFGSYAVI